MLQPGKIKIISHCKDQVKGCLRYFLKFDRPTFKQGDFNHLYINNDVEYHQMILPIKYQAQVFQKLHDGQGHQGMERTTALCRKHFYWSTMYKVIAKYVRNCPQCQVAKGPYVGPKTKPGSITDNGPLDLLCIDFTKMDPSRHGKENILVLTDAFSKFSQAFVTPYLKALIMAKITVDKWFYIYGIPAQVHSAQG